ncbi:MAG: hypothetical protein RLP02_15475, partial [Coleofasciculus sp. C2-GNP5-27]
SDREKIGRLISLSYLLDDKVSVMVIEPSSLSNIPAGFQPVFVFKPMEQWFSDIKVKPTMNIELTHQIGDLWLVQPRII